MTSDTSPNMKSDTSPNMKASEVVNDDELDELFVEEDPPTPTIGGDEKNANTSTVDNDARADASASHRDTMRKTARKSTIRGSVMRSVTSTTEAMAMVRQSVKEMRRKEAIKGYTRAELFGLIMGPLLFIVLCFVPISEEHPKAQLVAGVTVWIAVWWVCMVVPLAITALLPIIMFPLLEISTARNITASYFNSISWLLIGAFIVDFGIEKVELHKRVALKIILKLGTSPRMLLLSMMLVCAVLSGFCSNTSTTLMLVPFVLGILEKAEAEVVEEGRPEDLKVVRDYGRALLIGVAWSASIGGSATLIGTTGPAILANYHTENFPQADVPVTFATWSAYAVGISATIFIIAYTGVALFYVKASAMRDLNRENMKKAYVELGNFTRDELVVAVAQIFQVIFWFLNGVVLVPLIGTCTGADASNRQACFNEGGTWTSRFTSYDSGIACLAAATLFLVPSFSRPGERVLDWEFVNARMPWDVLILLGGGFAISRGFSDGGLSVVIAESLAGLQGLPINAVILVVTLVVIFLTEFTSNTATASIMIPVLGSAAEGIGVNPLAVLLPGTYATGMAFMLPIATPPNAIVYATKKLQFTSMVGGGFILNIISSLVILLFTATVGINFFGGGSWTPEEGEFVPDE